MAVATKVTLAVLLLASVGLAYLGPPPRRRVGLGVCAAVLAIGMGGYLAAVVVLATGAIVPGALVLALAGELVCAAGWLSRGEAPPSDDDSDDGGGGGGGRRPKPPPTDWDAFERAFRRYARERERQRV
jgi:heme A synthase